MDTEETTQVTDAKDNQENVETVEKDVQDKKPVDADKIAKKLQKRISKEQEGKHQALKEVEELKAKLAKYENNDKSIKELSDEEKAKQEEDAKDRRIKELEDRLAHNEDLKQTKQVFEESGLSVPDEVLDMVVVNDNKKTVANVQVITNFIERIKEDTRKELLAGKTPRTTGVKNKMTKEQIRNIKDTAERQKAMRDNWFLFS
ncbi:capsid assembly scaffolding protein Gp46 family protein [Ligilactobacillus salivarius]|uniref:capsid assembly scaffolding protein Gp46 family protein n=1 Tax=Ligilactobacillus salivarius TaxID=1624 RepID=UPI00136BD8BA|nr:DUF4355 domain-containing protein [Ligilactobacillus salivarius]